MKVIDKSMLPEWMSDTRTMKTLGQVLGTEPHRLAQVVRMNEGLTVQMLTEGLRNTFQLESGSSKFQPITSYYFEWTIQNSMIPRIKIAANCTSTGKDRLPFELILEDKYYNKYDTFALEDGSTLFVRAEPTYDGPKRWKYVVTLAGNDPNRSVDVSFMTKGRTTKFRSCYFPELSEKGYSKMQFNTEKHRGYISRHRNSMSYSSDWAVMEEIYLSNQKANGEMEYFKMNKGDKDILDNFLLAREGNLLFGECNFDINGKCLDFDDDGREIPMSDGVITQYTRYCDKFNFNTLRTSHLREAINTVAEKSGKTRGNIITIVCNRRFYMLLQEVMKDDVSFNNPTAAYYFTKKGTEVEVGAEFTSYIFMGNRVSFVVDEALTHEYGDKAYGIFMNTAVNDGVPNIAMFTLKGRELIYGTVAGLGGEDGKTSGSNATSLDGSSKHIIGYSGVAVMNPYAGFIMEEAVL